MFRHFGHRSSTELMAHQLSSKDYATIGAFRFALSRPIFL